MTPQSAAIPYRLDEHGGISILLVTSKTRKRWIIPKGKIGSRMLPSRSAEREAFEEAGVLGRIGKESIGTYLIGEQLPAGSAGVTAVRAFPLEVVDELPVWREMHLRQRRWFTMKQAIRAVRDPELRSLLRTFERVRRGLRPAR